MKSFHAVDWLRWACCDAVTLKHISDSLVRYVVAEIGEGAGDRIVAQPPFLGSCGRSGPRLQGRLAAVPDTSDGWSRRTCGQVSTQATSERSFRPRRLPMSASVAARNRRAGPRRAGAHRIRFSAP